MEIIFAKQYLKELHILGKTSEKKRSEEDYVSICNIVELSNHYK